MNRILRRSWIPLVVGGLVVLFGGLASSSSGAPDCNTVNDFTVTLSVTEVGFLQTNNSFNATVTALSACGTAVSSYKGPATLKASGTNTDGTSVSSGAAGIGDITLSFKQGIATPKITPTTDALGVRLTATDNSNATINESSVAFNVFDKVTGCGDSNCDGQIGDTKGPGGTAVSVDIPQTLTGFVGLSLSDPTLLATNCEGAPQGAVGFGQAYIIAPPAISPLATYTATVRFSKKTAPGTGVANFVHCMASPTTDVAGNTVLTYKVVPTCNKAPGPKCILAQSRNGVGELVVTFKLGPGPTDPGGTGFS